MSEEDKDIYRQRKPINPSNVDENNPMGNVQAVQKAMSEAKGDTAPPPAAEPIQVSGNVPPEFSQMMQQRGNQNPVPPAPVQGQPNTPPPPKPRATPDMMVKSSSGQPDRLQEVLTLLNQQQQEKWEPFTWPSMGKFYTDIPHTIHIRPMTGEEEQILATPRFVKRGQAIDMIFQKCIQENIPTEKLLSVDRTHLLIFLRGISYTPEYDVEIKCPSCGIKFNEVINLDLDVEFCPEDFTKDNLFGTLPVSGLDYKFRLSTGKDELTVSTYREQKIAKWGEQSEDDTLLYRTALLLEDLGGLSMTREIQMVIKKLSMEDVTHLRNHVSDPPFGVDTEIPIICPNCSEEFKIDLPLETSFFFPRKKETGQA